MEVARGDIPGDGPLAVLRGIEMLRTTGVLRFESGDKRGELAIFAGQVAVDQKTLDNGEDPVDVFLGLREGKYEVIQRLPPLPVSTGDDRVRRGSLAVHVPADLMNYCERAGLTGVLILERGDRALEAVYDRGELLGIRLDGRDDADLGDVFGWEEGKFRIQARAKAPSIDEEDDLDIDVTVEEDEPRKPRRRDETGQQFLRVVEVALSSIVDEREKRRSPTRTSPPLPPQPTPHVRAQTESQRLARSREPTVKIIYLSGEPPPPSRDARTRHASKAGGVERVLDAGAERPSAWRDVAVTAGWVAVVLALAFLALSLLARLPPVE